MSRSTDVEELLRINGPMLTSKVTQQLAESEGLKPDTARKTVQRVKKKSKNGIKNVSNISFPYGASLLYLPEHLKENYKKDFFKKLINTMKETNSAAGRLIIGLENRSGVVNKNHFKIESGLPTTQDISKHPQHSKILSDLIDEEIIEYKHIDGRRMVALKEIEQVPGKASAARKAEEIFLDQLEDWLRNLNFASYESIKTKASTDLPDHGPFNWAFKGPSFLRGLADYSKENNPDVGFVVGDINFEKKINKESLKPYLHKVKTLQHQGEHKNFLPFYICNDITKDAHDLLREKGVSKIEPSELFGEGYAESLNELMELMQNTSKKLKQEPEKIEQVINSIKSFKGTFNNLRSVVMELVVIRLLSNDGLQDPIQYNRDLHIKEEHHSKEIDVMAGNKDELLFVECKAKLPTNSITKEEIDKWEKKIAHTNSWLKENSEDSILTRYKREIKHVFCTNVELDDRAEDKISELDAKHQKRPIDLWSDGMLSEKLKDQGLLELKKDYEEHFEKSVN